MKISAFLGLRQPLFSLKSWKSTYIKILKILLRSNIIFSVYSLNTVAVVNFENPENPPNFRIFGIFKSTSVVENRVFRQNRDFTVYSRPVYSLKIKAGNRDKMLVYLWGKAHWVRETQHSVQVGFGRKLNL